MPDIDQLIKEKGGIRLDLGGGNCPQSGYVNMDMRPLEAVDIVHNVEVQPWPLPDASVLTMIASHLVEHINPHGGGFIRFMDEAWRVLRMGGEFAISCPHGASPGYLQDPTHCNQVNETTWAYFCPMWGENPSGLYLIYKPKPWRCTHLSWSPAGNIEVILVKVGEGNGDDG